MIYQTVNKGKFIEAFSNCKSSGFSLAALVTLYKYYDECGINVELDVILICASWNEFDNKDELVEAYSNTGKTYEQLKHLFTVIELPGGKVLSSEFV